MSTNTDLLHTTEFADAGAVVRITAHKIHEHESTRLIEAFRVYLANSGRRLIVLDFAEVEFVSSAGLGAMITLSRAVDELGGKTAFIGINDCILDVMKLTKLNRLLKIEKDLAKAQKVLLK